MPLQEKVYSSTVVLQAVTATGGDPLGAVVGKEPLVSISLESEEEPTPTAKDIPGDLANHGSMDAEGADNRNFTVCFASSNADISCKEVVRVSHNIEFKQDGLASR